jgi:hypothetical protein
MCVYVYMCVHAYVCMYMCVHVNVYACIYIYVHVYVYVYMCVHVYVCACICVCMYVCVCVLSSKQKNIYWQKIYRIDSCVRLLSTRDQLAFFFAAHVHIYNTM